VAAADIAFKPYACGTMAHPYIDCARKLVAEGVVPDDVASIECKTAEGIASPVGRRPQNPPNGYAAKFSIPYAIAVGMLRGDAGLMSTKHGGARSRGASCGKVHYVVDPDNSPAPIHRHLRVTPKAAKYARQARAFRGGRRATSAAALEAKFIANCWYGGGTRIAHSVSLCARAAHRAAGRPPSYEANGAGRTAHCSKARSRWSPVGATSGALSRWRPPTREGGALMCAPAETKRAKAVVDEIAARGAMLCWLRPTSRSELR
jgi:hypothetical protein